MRRVALAALAVMTFASSASAQSAADVAAARDLFIEGSRLSNLGDWVHAQDQFERSLKLKRAPITLFSLGVVETHTGKLVEALEHLRAFLAEPSAPATKPYEAPARSAITELEHRVAHCKLVLTPRNAPDLSVTVDGDAVPPAALAVARVVNPGNHSVTATARGFRPLTRPCNVTEGARATVDLTLEAAAPIAPAPPPSPLVLAEPPVAGPVATVVAPDRPSRVVPITLLSVGGVVFVTGLGVGLAGIQQAGSATTREGSQAEAARTKGIAGDVLGGLGIATAAAGAILWIVQARGSGSPRPAQAAGSPITLSF